MFDFVTEYDEREKIWTGPKRNLVFDEDMSAGEMALYMMSTKNPQDIMQISDTEGSSLTYGSALTSAKRMAQHFKKIKLTADDVVGIFAGNHLSVTPVVLASLFNGTPFQPVNCAYETSVLKHIYSFSRPKVIFCDGHYYDRVKEASDSFKPLIYTLCNHLDSVAKMEDLLEPTETEHFFRPEPLKYGPRQTVAIMTSSGTTGLPKGVCISNKFNGLPSNAFNGSSTNFSTSSISWFTGLFILMATFFRGGKMVLTTKPLTPEYLLEIIVKYKINFLATNPEYMMKLSLLPQYNKESMESIQLIFMAGAYCSAANLKRIRSVLRKGALFYTYGTTEFGGIAGNLFEYKTNSMGKLTSNIQLKIKDTTTGECLGINQIGEICARHMLNSRQWLGYYKDQEATKHIIDSDNFIHTGDLGFMDEEHYLHITGRCKEIMKYLGFQYSPQVTEAIIMEIPDVLDVCVFGVFDEYKYDVPAAAVVKRPGSSLSAKEIMDYVCSKTEMPHNQIHYGVFFLEELSRNHNGKFMREKVKDTCLTMEKGIASKRL